MCKSFSFSRSGPESRTEILLLLGRGAWESAPNLFSGIFSNCKVQSTPHPRRVILQVSELLKNINVALRQVLTFFETDLRRARY
jgi:hypothetical protein